MNGSGLILDNADIAELFAFEAERGGGHLQRALRNAARKALLWPQEAADLARANNHQKQNTVTFQRGTEASSSLKRNKWG